MVGDQFAALNLRGQVVAQGGGGVEAIGELGADKLVLAVHLNRPPHHPSRPGEQHERHHQ